MLKCRLKIFVTGLLIAATVPHSIENGYNPDEIDLQIGLYYLALFAAISSKLAEIEFGVPADWGQGKF